MLFLGLSVVRTVLQQRRKKERKKKDKASVMRCLAGNTTNARDPWREKTRSSLGKAVDSSWATSSLEKSFFACSIMYQGQPCSKPLHRRRTDCIKPDFGNLLGRTSPQQFGASGIPFMVYSFSSIHRETRMLCAFRGLLPCCVLCVLASEPHM